MWDEMVLKRSVFVSSMSLCTLFEKWSAWECTCYHGVLASSLTISLLPFYKKQSYLSSIMNGPIVPPLKSFMVSSLDNLLFHGFAFSRISHKQNYITCSFLSLTDFFLFNIMHLRFTNVSCTSLFSFLISIPLYSYTTHWLFIHH